MKLHDPEAYTVTTEREVIRRLLPLAGARALELGCGRAEMTRILAEEFPLAEIVATEVDEVQHRNNQAIRDLTKVSFRLGGAEAIPEPDASFDLVFMLKSLHHVPIHALDQALGEVRRVLKPGGLAYISEPVFAGPFNEIMRLFNDEQRVREAAFAALKRATESGLFQLREEIFFETPFTYPDFRTFADRVINVTYAAHQLDEGLYNEVRNRFMAHMTEQGARFLKPIRVDVLRRPG